MTTRARIALLAVAAVILVGAFVVLGTGGEDDGANPETTGAQQQAQTEPTTEAVENPNQPETREKPPAPRVERVRMRDGGPAGEPRRITFESGDTIRLRFTSNVDDEVHIHGYEKTLRVPGGGAGTISFKAGAEGRFEIESHTTNRLLATLEVRPG
jgi:hypothetical protein